MNLRPGQPTKYRKEYCKKLIEWMSQGFSFESFAGTVDVSRQTVHDWVKANEEFLEAKRIGDSKSRIWWEKLHRRCAGTGEGNATMIVWAQKNKWPKEYRERAAKQKFQIDQKLNHAMTGDFKTLVANMTPEQLYGLISAAENHVKQIEDKHETKENKA